MTLEVPYRSIPDMLLQRIRATPDKQAFGGPNADDTAIEWLTWTQVGDRTKAYAAGLVTLGVGVEDRVAIISGTRLEWVLADLGVNLAGAATTTVYPTTEPDEAAYIVADSGSKVVIAEDPKQALKISGATGAVTHVVLIEGLADASAQPPQITLAELEERGRARLAEQPALVEEIVGGLGPDHLATLIYTSGTTGKPKGVQLPHSCWTWEGVAQSGVGLFEEGDLQFLWLPLAHAFGKCLLCGVIHVGVPTYVDGRVDKLVELLPMVKPTLMCAAPRIFEKVYNKTVTTATGDGGLKAKIFGWAVETGKRKVALEQAKKPVPGALKAQYALAERLVFSKLQQRLGGHLRLLVSGAAPLSRDIAEFFAAANLPISEGYGLTETSAAIFVNRHRKVKIGTVGEALGDLECRIDTDGEILVRGRAIMRGYHNMPEETEKVFTEDGWLRTGDIGELDHEGYLKITDRKKDLVKTSGGKYIAPSAIEGMFKAICPYTSQVVIVGQARNYVTMLVSLDEDGILAWAAGGPHASKTYEQIVATPEAEAMVAGYVSELNAKLNRWETVKKFAVLPRDLSIDRGEITPSLKVKRRNVESNFSAEIEKMYEGTLAEFH
jgi:long-chain acyl-CoA synthetase